MHRPAALLAALAATAAAHMEMRSPAPLNSKHNPHTDPSSIDYSMTSPLARDGSDYPCKGYHSLLGTPAGAPTASLEAGAAARVALAGGAVHGGGSCQVSLSTDGAATFRVLKSVVGGCPAATDGDGIDFRVPLDVPPGDAVLAWSWHNRIGNREMYMNCAAVTVTRRRGGGGAGGSSRQMMQGGGGGVSYSSLPGIFVANVGNGCSVAEGGDVVYPDPGVDVVEQSTNPLAPDGECGSSPSSPPPPSSPPGHKGRKGYKNKGVAKGTKEGKAGKEGKGRYNPAGPRRPSTAMAGHQRPNTLPKAAAKGPPASGPHLRPNPRPGPGSSSPGPGPGPGSGSGSGSAPPSTGGERHGGSDHSAAGTACADEGAWDCLPGGGSFLRCASGRWSVVMSMPAGTVCVPGVAGTLDMQDARY